MQDVCHMNFVIDLTDCRVSVARWLSIRAWNLKVWGSNCLGESEFFLCPLLVIRQNTSFSRWFLLPWIFTVTFEIENWCQNVVRMSVTHLAVPCVTLFALITFWRHLWSNAEQMYSNMQSVCLLLNCLSQSGTLNFWVSRNTKNYCYSEENCTLQDISGQSSLCYLTRNSPQNLKLTNYSI